MNGDLRRIEFVTRRYIELRGLTPALLGAIVTLSALFARASLARDGALNTLFEVPMMAMMMAIAPIEIGYQLAFGRAKPPFWRDLAGAVPVVLLAGGIFADWGQLAGMYQAPASVGALLFAMYASWISVRDWRWRPYYVLLCAASAIALATTANLAETGTYFTRALTYFRSYAVLGAGITAVGLLDHRLLITSLHHAAPPPTIAQRIRFARLTSLTAMLLAAFIPVAFVMAGSDDSSLALGLGGAFIVAYILMVGTFARAAHRWRIASMRHRGAPDLASYSPLRVPLTTAPLVMAFAVIDAAAFDVLAPVRLFPLASACAVGAASAWWAMREWPARSHYLVGAAAATATVILLIAAPMTPIRAFTWLVLTSSAGLAIETFVDYRVLRQRAAGDGGEEVHGDAV